MKSPKIIISEADVVGNKGAVAMVNCIIKGVKIHFPEAKFIVTSKFIKDPFIMKDNNIEILYDGEQEFDIPLVKVWVWWLLNRIGINKKSLLENNVAQKFLNADLVISASGISFNDNFGLIKIYHFTKYLQLPLFLNKRVIKFTQTFGPFESLYNRIIAQLVLNNIHTIMPRGRHSIENLKKINVKNNVLDFPDIAMTMDAQCSEKADIIISKLNGRNIIGFSPNIVCKRLDKNKEYVKSLEKLCKHIMEKYNDSYILFIPHTIEEKNLNREDDYSICNELLEQIKDYKRSEVVNTLEYSPEEIKWLISKCDFYIGSRFHSLIASISSCVPSIAIGWHWKYNEMMEWVELENNVIQYWDLTEEKLLKLFESNYSNKIEVKSKLENIVPKISEKANGAITYIAEVLNEKD
jgi:colanic acid/amylovoran biosynthesis protein